jgi:hypothetical protein
MFKMTLQKWGLWMMSLTQNGLALIKSSISIEKEWAVKRGYWEVVGI